MKPWMWIVLIIVIAFAGWAYFLNQSPKCGCGG